ncbi:MAG: AMP-binding protein [Acidimicrobiia bacterium]
MNPDGGYESFGLALGAELHPDRPAASDEFGTAYTYDELNRMVDQAIHTLHDAGVVPGDVIALLLENRAEAILLHQVAYRGGFFFTPLNPRLKTSELEYLLTDSQAKFLFLDALHTGRLAEVDGLSNLTVVTVGDGDEDALTLPELITGSPDDPVEHQFGSVMSYTSGTTGRPKAVIRERHRPSPEALKVMARFGERLGFNPVHDRHLSTAPLYHGGPLISAMHAVNLLGSIRLMRRFDALHVLETISEEKITSAYMVPTMYHRLLSLPEDVRVSADTSSLKSIMHTGAPCPPHLKAQMIEWLGPVIYECYAATEGYGTYTVCTSEQWLEHPGTVGKPEHDVITIRDNEGNALPKGEIGLVYAKTLPGVAPFQYRGDPEKTDNAYGPEGDYTLGDMGYLDPDGFLYLTGRATDMIISGGVNIYPAEVEQTILQHPRVRDVAVFGVPDEEWGETVAAAVQRSTEDTSLREEDIISFCRERIATYKCPRRVFLVDDLGRDPSGKLRKTLLRDSLVGEVQPR